MLCLYPCFCCGNIKKKRINSHRFFLNRHEIELLENNNKSLNKLKPKRLKILLHNFSNNTISMYQKSYIQFDENQASITMKSSC